MVQKPLTTQEQILEYLFEHEDLLAFIKRIAHAGKNKGAERPYVVKSGSKYIVIEGNTRTAAYKVLAGLLKPSDYYSSQIPFVSEDFKSSLLVVDCAIAPNRDALLPIMAESHFGIGDKSKWGYLGSRKAICDEIALGKSQAQIGKAFGLSQAEVIDYLIEYRLYLEALDLQWTGAEKQKLLNPRVQFNPPVRFLQTKGHKEALGIEYDRLNLLIKFSDVESKEKFQHLIRKLVVNPTQGLGATAAYTDVFKDFESKIPSNKAGVGHQNPTPVTGQSASPSANQSGPSTPTVSANAPAAGPKLKAGALYNYPVKAHNNLIKQLMKECADINCLKLPASATFLIRNLLEAILKHIIDQCGANSKGSSLSLEGCLSLCSGNTVPLTVEDKKILKDFQKNHLDYLNLGAHGNIVPHPTRVFQIRDLLDQFVKSQV